MVLPRSFFLETKGKLFLNYSRNSYQFRYCSMNNSGLIFVGCNNLKSISLPKGLPLSLDEEEFEGMSPFIGCTSLETIKAPEELKDADWLKEISDRVEVAFY